MAVWTNTWAQGTQPASFHTDSVGFVIQVVTVYNNSPAQISVSQYPQASFPGSGVVVPAGYPMNIAVSNWRELSFISDGTAPAAKSSLVVIATDNPLGLSTALSLFGPSGWGAGSGPTFEPTAVNIGDPIAAWNLNQLVDLFNFNWGASGFPPAQNQGWWVGWNPSNGLAEVALVNLYNGATPADAFSFWDYVNGITLTKLLRIAGTGDVDLFSGTQTWRLHPASASFQIQDVTHAITALFYSAINNSTGFPGKLNPGSSDGTTQVNSGIYAGNGAPNNANGVNGDFYFRGDGAAGTFIYHKAAGTWTAFA